MARPRSEEAREAALGATVDLVLEVGVDGVTFEEVAARSGVAKSTLYRHFGTKQSMVAAAVSSCMVQHTTPDTGVLAEDLREIFDGYKATEEARRLPDIFPAVVAGADTCPELQCLADAILEERRRPIRTVLQLAQLRGEVQPDTDLDVAFALLIGPFVHRRMVERREITPEFRDAVIEVVVAGLGSIASAPTR